MDLSSVIGSFLTGQYVVTRQAPAKGYTAGRLDAPDTSTFTIDACVQPAGGRDLQRLPEGMRVMEIKAIFTATELKTAGSGQDPDLVTIDGEDYEVQKVERWAELGSYWKALALKVGN